MVLVTNTGICTNNINGLVFVMDKQCVFAELRTKRLDVADIKYSIKGASVQNCNIEHYPRQIKVYNSEVAKQIHEIKFFKFYSHQLMHFLIQPCIRHLSYIKIT